MTSLQEIMAVIKLVYEAVQWKSRSCKTLEWGVVRAGFSGLAQSVGFSEGLLQLQLRVRFFTGRCEGNRN